MTISLLILIAVTAIVFGIGEAIMLPNVMKPMFKEVLGDQVLDKIRLGPAAMFYVIHIAGLIWFASAPALRDGQPGMALLNGALLGLIAFSCYEMTSWTIMRDWSPRLVVADIAWGTFISGVSSWAAVLAARALQTTA